MCNYATNLRRKDRRNSYGGHDQTRTIPKNQERAYVEEDIERVKWVAKDVRERIELKTRKEVQIVRGVREGSEEKFSAKSKNMEFKFD